MYVSFNPRNPLSQLLLSPTSEIPQSASKISAIGNSTIPDLSNIPKKKCHSIEHCPFSNEEILENTLLDSFPIGEMPDITQEMRVKNKGEAVRRLAANLAAGGLITGGNSKIKLDGMWDLPNLMAWEWMIENLWLSLPESQEIEKLLIGKLLERISHLKNFAKDLADLAKGRSNDEAKLLEISLGYAQKIQKLKPGESLPFTGGWTNEAGGSGHALVYEFVRNDDQTYDVNLFTATNYQLTDKLLAGDKVRIKPLVRYAAIPEHVICFNQDGKIRPIFIQHFIEIQLGYLNKEIIVDQEDILELFDYLADYRTGVTWDETGAPGGQRAGTCVPSSTKLWMRHFVGHSDRHRQIMAQCYLRLLIGSYRALKEDFKKDSLEGALSRRLLMHMARNYVRLIAKALTTTPTPLINEEFALKGQATAYHLLQEIQQIEGDIVTSRQEERALVDLIALETTSQRKKRLEDRNLIEPYSSNLANNTPQGIFLPKLDVVLDSAKKLKEFVDDLSSTKLSAESFSLEFHHLIDQLPIPIPLPREELKGKKSWIEKVSTPFWGILSLEELETALDQIYQLAQLYRINISEKDSLARCQVTIVKLHTLSHYLAIKIDTLKNQQGSQKTVFKKPCLENFKIPHFEDISHQIEGLLYLEKRDFEIYQQAAAYFKAFDLHTQNNFILFETEDTTKVVKYSVHESLANGTYWESLIENDDQLEETVWTLAEYRKDWKELGQEKIDEIYKQELVQYEKTLEEYYAWETYRREEEEHLLKQEEYEILQLSYQSGGLENPPESPIAPTQPGCPKQTEEPKEPQKRVDLPRATKYTLILEEAVKLDTTTNPLLQCGYKHVVILRRMTFWANRRIYGSAGEDLSAVAIRHSIYNLETKVDKPGSSKKIASEILTRALSEQRALKRELTPLFAEKKIERQKRNRSKAEAAALQEGTGISQKSIETISPSLLNELLRISSEWRLAPLQTIRRLQEELESLKDPALQAIIFRLFFRSPIGNKGEAHLGTGELIVEDTALYLNCKQFIIKGLNHFFGTKEQNQENEAKTAMQGARFFFEFSFYVAQYLHDAQKREPFLEIKSLVLKEMERWLEAKDLPPDQIAIIHHYRALFLSLNQFEAQTDQATLSLYHSWIFSTIYPDDGVWKTLALLTMQKKFITIFTVRLQKSLEDPEFRNFLGKGLLRLLQLDNCEADMEWEWTPSSPNLLKTSYGNEFWIIDLISGKVYGKSGQIGCGSAHHPWERTRDFERLFGGQRNFVYISIGDDNYTFTHPEKGIFRLIVKYAGGYWCGSSRYEIEHQFPGSRGKWFKYFPAFANYKSVPKILAFDHTYWIPLDGDIEQADGTVLTGYFASLNDLKRCFATTSEGKIVEVESNEGALVSNYQRIDYVDANDLQAVEGLTDFENGKNILTYRNNAEELTKISFPRYHSAEAGNRLEFIVQKDGRIIWSENSEYALSKKKPKGYLGTIPNYLYLQASDEKKNSHKILVPFQEIKSGQIPIPDPSATLELDNQSPLIESDKRPSPEQWGCFQYFVFDIIDGKIKSTSLEGQFYLAYIYFSQRKYHKAIKLITNIKPVEEPSAISMRILHLIQTFPEGEDHPDAKMVCLKALLLSMQARDKKANQLISDYFGTNFASLWGAIVQFSEALQALNNISVECRFSIAEEKELVDKLIAEGSKKQATIIQKCIPRKNEQIFIEVMTHLRERSGYLESEKKIPRKPFELTGGTRILPASQSGRVREKFFRMLPRFVPLPPKAPLNKEEMIANHGEQEGLRKFLLEQGKYKKEYADFELKINTFASWLNEGNISLKCTRPSRSTKIAKNGKLLLEVNRIAKDGSQDAKKEMAYRLAQWRLHSTGDQDTLRYLDCMLSMLLSPENFPNPIDPSIATPLQKYEYLKVIEYFRSSLNLETISELLYAKKSRFVPQNLSKISYAIPQQSALDFVEKRIEEVQVDPIPLKIQPPNQQDRWQDLQMWKKSYLTEDPDRQALINDTQDFLFSFSDYELKEEESDYEGSLKADLKLLVVDYEEGKKQNNEVKRWTMTEENALKLAGEAEQKAEFLKEQIESHTKELLKKANKKSHDSIIRQLENAQIGGGVIREITFSDCVDNLLSLDYRKYQLINSNLTTRECEEIATLTLEIENLKSYLAQVKRIQDLATEIREISVLEDPTRCYLCQQLSANLDAFYDFELFENDPEVLVALHVFSGQSGLIPHSKQVRLIKKMLEIEESDPNRYKDIIIQLIMGGGKTSVLATIVLYLAAKRKGRISLFVVPPALFKTVEANISESMRQAFLRHVQSIDFNREDLTTHNLRKTLKLLESSQEQQQPIVTKATTLQCFELEFLAQSRQLKKLLIKKQDYVSKFSEIETQLFSLNQSETLAALKEELSKGIKEQEILIQSCKEKIILLAQIWKKMATTADALMDEVDLLLDCLQEVNFPDGDTIPIDPTINQLLHHTFKALVSQRLTVEGGELLRDVVRLHENKQALMKEKYALVQPVLAKHLIDDFEPFQDIFPEEYLDSFKRYLSGNMPPILQDYADNNQEVDETLLSQLPNHPYDREMAEADIAFLQQLDKLYVQSDQDKQKVSLIATARHLLDELLPFTLSNSGGINYGRKKKAETLTIIPYLGVKTPASTQFGYYLEEACYYYQWAAAFPVKEKDIINQAKLFESTARYYVEKNQEKFEETVEFEEFGNLFGITLDQMRDPAMRQQAVSNIAKDVEKKLDLQFEIVAEKVRYRSERLTSNGHDLCHQVSSRRTQSGTPYNAEGYDSQLLKRFEEDVGTEGKIWHKMAEKAREGQVHLIDFKTIEEFLTHIFKGHPSPERIRGIIETGSLFNIFPNNLAVAKAIMAHIEKWQKEDSPIKVSSQIEAVLFFHKDPGQTQPDTLYVWRKGATQPERIGGTSKESLRAKGLEPSKYFVYLDDRHTTGIDILQLPDAINILTFGPNMTRRKKGQGTMRLRQFLYSQMIEVAVSKETIHLMLGGGKTLKDLILTSEKNQSIKKTEHMPRYFQQQIHSLARHQAVENLIEAALNLDKNQEEFMQTVIQSEPFFVTFSTNDGYLLHGKLKRKLDTKRVLKEQVDQKVEQFQRTICRQQHGNIEDKAIQLKEHIENSTALPSKLLYGSAPIGLEQEVELYSQTEIHQEVEIETAIETNIKLELQRYVGIESDSLLKEKKMTEEEFLTLIQALKEGREISFKMETLQHQLSNYDYGLLEEKVNYQEIFKQAIFGTHAYFYADSGKILPVFHPLQRPPEQVLAVRTGTKFHWLLLSQYEANAAKKYLEKLYKENSSEVNDVWLVQLDSSPIALGDTFFPDQEDEVEAGMFELNVFAGNVQYLDKRHPDEIDGWMAEERNLKIRFLKLRVAHDDKKNEILRRNILPRFDETVKHSPKQYLSRKRAERESMYQGKYRFEPLQAKTLNPGKVRHLYGECAKYLGIDWELRDTDPLTKQALEQLGRDLPVTEDREALLQEKAEKLTKAQFSQLQRFQIACLVKEQMQWLLPRDVPFLKSPEQICDFKNTSWTFYLTFEQVKELKKSQAHLIPYVNPAFYSHFTEGWQIGAINLEHLDQIKVDMWMWLKKEQIKKLSPATTTDQLMHLKLPKNYGFIDGNLLEKIPANFLYCVCAEQIQEITSPDLIKKLEAIAKFGYPHQIPEGQWSSWIAPKMVPHIDFDTQLPHLKQKAQIREVPFEHVEKLDPKTQVCHIRDVQVKYLKGKEQIENCPSELLRELEEEQLPYLSKEQIKKLKAKTQIQTIIDPECFQHLTAEFSFENDTINQIALISNQQLELVTPTQVRGLSNAQLLHLSQHFPEHWEQIRGELSEQQVKSFDSQELIDLLQPEQIREWLEQTQIQFLFTQTQIQSCPDSFVKYLTPEQVSLISQQQVKRLRGETQVQAIEEQSLFIYLENAQLKWISDAQIEWVLPKHVPGLSSNQLLVLKALKKEAKWPKFQDKISREQVVQFDSTELIDLLTADQITRLLSDEKQVSFLKEEWQIKACPAHLVQFLDNAQISQISPQQAAFLQGAEQVKSCPISAEHVAALQKQHFLHLTDVQMSLLTETQIEQMDNVQEANRLTPQQLLHVKPELAKEFDANFVEKLNKAGKSASRLLKGLKPELIHLITNRDAIQELTQEQVDKLSLDQIHNFPKKHPLLGRINRDQLQQLKVEKISDLPVKQLCHLEKPEHIHAVSFWKIKHLTRDQLRQRTWGQFIAYTVGVVVLGVAASIVALVAYMSLIPLAVQLSHPKKGKLMTKQLKLNPKRLYNYIQIFYFGTLIDSR